MARFPQRQGSRTTGALLFGEGRRTGNEGMKRAMDCYEDGPSQSACTQGGEEGGETGSLLRWREGAYSGGTLKRTRSNPQTHVHVSDPGMSSISGGGGG